MTWARFFSITLFIVLTSMAHTKPVDYNGQMFMASHSSHRKLKSASLLKYLIDYGYLRAAPSTTQRPKGGISKTDKDLQYTSGYSYNRISTALSDLQKYMGVSQTGVVNTETENLLTKPRCGEVDKHPRAAIGRSKRQIASGNKLTKTFLSYTISSYSGKMPFLEQNETVWKAIRTWGEKIPIRFGWATSNADIEISFKRGNDTTLPKSFDGLGGKTTQVANNNGKHFIYFDDDEYWFSTSRTGVTGEESFFSATLHAIGHVLGLTHSDVIGSVMRPSYDVSRQHSSFVDSLSSDDLMVAQNMYGRCETRMDAIFSHAGDGKTYVFRGDRYWRISSGYKADEGYPQSIESKWHGLPRDIDAALLWGNNWKTYFFKGSQYYRYDTIMQRVADGYPQPIKQGWSGVPDDIDAAFTDNNFITYFFKDNKIYRYDNTRDKVSIGYPKNISDVFLGLPAKLDTAFRYYWDGDMYFFHDKSVWKWDVTQAKALGPYQIKDSWQNLCDVYY